ncbi:MAG: type VI secretion system tip protein VgrG [Acidobacteria bacterium]|nr:type VI secretion system tip protein VgrG [Acidobacteriota bacterium]
MADKYLEENRYLYIESKLGPNELLLESFTGSEGISQLFCFQLELLSENKRIKFEDILGKEISFGVVGTEDGERRFIHGIVTAFAQLPDASRLSRYRAVVSPKFWILTRKQNCRIFQNLSVPDILKSVLEGLDVTWELQGSYQPREYCVQYRETDHNFASRLMEEEGIFYFFRFTKDSHKLVISDNKASHHDMPAQSSLIYEEVIGGAREEGRISGWIKTQELGSGKFSLQDYFFETPQTNLFSSQDILPNAMVGKINHKLKVAGNDQFEVYDYPGNYDNKGSGKEITKHAMEQLEMSQFVIQGESNVYHLTPGYRFKLKNHPGAEGSYILTTVTHSASEGGFHSADEAGHNHYANSFRCIPLSLLFRPPQQAAKSRVWGCQTAVVVGAMGEEIYTDKYGRVKVQFHWDRDGRNNESSSCWIRVATHWAGQQWGAIHLPRVGQEVIVDFLEGDPDRPIIVGSVYNADQMPPYALPDNKTQSGIKSDSSPRSGGYNEIRFEDLDGNEEIHVHAQKDMNTEVENDKTLKVHHDETIEVENNRTTTIEVDDKTTVNGNMTLTVQKDRSATIMGNDSETVYRDSTVNIMGSESRTITQSRNTKITMSDTLMAGGTISVTASGLTITAPTITLNAAMVQITGVVQCATMIASASVVSPSYSPGVGNMM